MPAIRAKLMAFIIVPTTNNQALVKHCFTGAYFFKHFKNAFFLYFKNLLIPYV